MKALPLFSAVPLATSACAQLVNDGATNTLSKVTNSFTGDVTVGTNGSFTLLVLSDSALLTNSDNGLVGLNATAKSNEVRLISSSARWQMGGDLHGANFRRTTHRPAGNVARIRSQLVLSAGNLPSTLDTMCMTWRWEGLVRHENHSC